MTFGAHTSTGELDGFGGIEIPIDLNSLEAREAEQLLNGGVPFRVTLDLDLSSKKNEPIETAFVDSKEKIPARTKSDGTVIPAEEILAERRYVSGTSRVRTPSSENSNVSVRDDGRLTFTNTIEGRTTATFSGSFNFKPDTSRTSSFSISVFTKRPDYVAREESRFAVRLKLTPRR